MESLTGIVYASKAKKHFDEEALDVLVEKATANNLKFGITGFLFFKKNHFLQYIEGEDEEVNELMERINHDPDHDVKFISKQPNLRRKKFQLWSMVLIKNITMELVLMDYLIAISSSATISDEKYQNIWRMVDKVTSKQIFYLTN